MCNGVYCGPHYRDTNGQSHYTYAHKIYINNVVGVVNMLWIGAYKCNPRVASFTVNTYVGCERFNMSCFCTCIGIICFHTLLGHRQVKFGGEQWSEVVLKFVEGHSYLIEEPSFLLMGDDHCKDQPCLECGQHPKTNMLQ